MADNRTFACMRYRALAHATRDCMNCPMFGKSHTGKGWTNCHGATITPSEKALTAYAEVHGRRR